jgi:uncharacterized membrane protein YeaQ/YmgE (transglycosylase-associated protein family)
MGILSWLLMGLVVGLLARFIMPGKQRGGMLVTILLGIGGGFLGGLIGSWLGWGTVTGFDLRSILLAVGGALLILLIFRSLRNK